MRFCIHGQKLDIYYEVIIMQYRKWVIRMALISFKINRHLVELMFALVTVMQDGFPWSQSVFCTLASSLQRTPLNVENTPVALHSRVAGVEECHWFFGQFPHSLVPKVSITRLEYCLRKKKVKAYFRLRAQYERFGLPWDHNQEPIETVSCLRWPNLVSPYSLLPFLKNLILPEKSALVNGLNGTSYGLSCKAMNM